MLMRILRGIRDNPDDTLEWIEILGSFVTSIIIIFLNFFGINNITVEIAILLSILGLLAISRHLDRKINQGTRQSTQEALQMIQTLGVEQTTSQGMLRTLSSGVANLDTNQSALEQSFQTLSNSVKSLTKNKFYPNQDEAFKTLLEYINNNPVKEATFLQYSCKQSEILLYPLVLNKKASAVVYIQHEEMPTQLKSERQVDRITSTIRNSLSDLSRKLPDPSNLRVYKFKTPASVRAIKIDDQVLCVGWYTYERVNRKGWSTYSDDETAVSGHDRPTIVAWKGTEEYDVLNQMLVVMVQNYQEHAEIVPL